MRKRPREKTPQHKIDMQGIRSYGAPYDLREVVAARQL
jgi:hypothetical protein